MFSRKMLCVSLWLILFTTFAKADGPQPPVRYKVPKKIYLANPMGFSAQQKKHLLPELVRELESLGLEVIEPFFEHAQIDYSQSGWAYQVGQNCVQAVEKCDGIFAVVNGTPPDEGVMVELGLAMAQGKKIFLFRDDFRRCTDSEKYPLNIMLFAGLPEETWEKSYYTSADEITSPNKKLSRWAKS